MSSRRRRQDFAIILANAADVAGYWIMIAAAVAVAFAVIYVYGGIVTGKIYIVPKGEMERVAFVLGRTTESMKWSGCILSIMLILRYRESAAEWYAAIAGSGLFFWFGTPLLVQWLNGAYHHQVGDVQKNAALQVVLANMLLVGQLVLAPLVLPLIYGVFRRLRLRPEPKPPSDAKLRRESPKGGRPRSKPHVLSPCWHLPYCRDYLLSVCPAFKARRRCWKYGGGCFCDSSMIESMISGAGSKTSQQAYMRSEIEARTGVMRERRKKPPCKRCFIYLEHQKLKYDALHPMMYPLTAALIYFAYEPFILPLFLKFMEVVERIWAQIAFGDSAAAREALRQVGEVASGTGVVSVMIAVLIGMFLLLFLLELADRWCYEWKL